MIMSKYEKKLMSIIMIAVIVFSGFVYAPKADAADDTMPEVTVLGATLRLNKEGDNKGTQSMRIGIKIANADKAKDCAIKLELNGKSYTVATSETALGSENGIVHNAIHSSDSNNVVYAVVLKNIPETSFYDTITITGKAISNDGQETIKTSTAAQKNVMGIVNSLQKKYPDLGIKINSGTLVKKGDIALTNADLTGYNTDDPEEYEPVSVDLSTVNLPTGAEYDSQTGSIKFTGTDISQIEITDLYEALLGETVEVHITGSVAEGATGMRCWPSQNLNTMTADGTWITHTNTGDFDITKDMVIFDKDGQGHKKATGVIIKASAPNTKLTGVTISSISVTCKGNPAPTPVPTERPVAESFNVPLSKDTVKYADWYYIAEADNIFNAEDGSVQFVLPSDGGLNAANAFYFKADKTGVCLSDYSKLVVTLSSDQENTGYRMGIAPDNSLKWDDNTILASKSSKIGTTEGTIELDLNKVATDAVGYGFVIQHTGWASSANSPNITIKSIRLEVPPAAESFDVPLSADVAPVYQHLTGI